MVARQISGRLKREGVSVSHETIYAMIRKDGSGELASHCRHRMRYRRKVSRRHETRATNIRNRVSIHERPAEADGKRFGDWEMDLIVDRDSNAILTLTERSTNFLLMENQAREEGRAFGKGRLEVAAALQGRGAEVHHHGQRQRILRA